MFGIIGYNFKKKEEQIVGIVVCTVYHVCDGKKHHQETQVKDRRIASISPKIVVACFISKDIWPNILLWSLDMFFPENTKRRIVQGRS